MTKFLSSWCLPNLYPLGIQPIFDSNKCGFLIWSQNNLCYLVINDVLHAINNDQPPSRSYADYPETSIKSTITTDYNVVFITGSGEIMYFESRKKITTITNVKDVKAICQVRDKIILIRCCSGMQIVLEIYGDNTSEFSRLHEFDISFGEDYCQGGWDLSEFHVQAFAVTEKNCDFIKNALKCENPNEILERIVIVYSINNHLFAFWSSQDDGDDEIVPLNTFTTNVLDFWMPSGGQSLFILLESGHIEILFWSDVSSLPTFSKVYMGSEIICYTHSEHRFAYSDGFDVIQMQMSFNKTTNQFQAENFTTELVGVSCLTYVETIKKIICVTENRGIYCLDVKTNCSDAVDDIVARFIEVDECFLSKVSTAEKQIALEKQIEAQLDKSIEEEYKTFESLALAQNYKDHWKLFDVTVKIQANIPEITSKIVFPDRLFHYSSDTYFLLINITPNTQQTKCLDKLKSWQFHIEAKSLPHNDKTINLIPIEPHMLTGAFQIVLVRQIEEYFIPPKISLGICCTATLGSDQLFLTLPLKLSCANFAEMFRIVFEEPTHLRSFGSIHLGHLVERNLIQYKMRVPRRFDIAKMFSESDGKETTLFVVFVNKYCKLERLRDTLMFEADDPGVLYIVKDFVGQKLPSVSSESISDWINSIMNIKMEAEDLSKTDFTYQQVLKLLKNVRDSFI